MGIFGRQFGRPSGPIGGLVGKLMARGNAPFNTALVHRLHQLYPNPTRIVEVGCGPGVGLSALLAGYPSAHVLGIDLCSQRWLRAKPATHTPSAVDDWSLAKLTSATWSSLPI